MNLRSRAIDMMLGAVAAAALCLWLVRPASVRAAEGAGPESAPQPEFVMETSTTAHGGAVLFLLDTRTEVLAVYEAEGGSRATRGVTFVGARKIARDVYVTGYNDKSEYSYRDLLDRYDREGEPATPKVDSSGQGPGPRRDG